MPVPMIWYPPPPPRRICPACQFIERRCPENCPLDQIFPQESQEWFESVQSPTFWLLANFAPPDRHAAAVAAVNLVPFPDGVSPEVLAFLVEELLVEVARREDDGFHRTGPGGLPVVESLWLDLFVFVPDLRPIDQQLHDPIPVDQDYDDFFDELPFLE